MSRNPHGFDTARAFASEGLKLIAITLVLATFWVTLDLIVDDEGAGLPRPATTAFSEISN